MVSPQINLDYFDERSSRTNNCPFERQLAGGDGLNNCGVLRGFDEQPLLAFGAGRLDDRRKPCNFGHRSAHRWNTYRRFLGLIYVRATTLSFRACEIRDLRNDQKALEGGPFSTERDSVRVQSCHYEKHHLSTT